MLDKKEARLAFEDQYFKAHVLTSILKERDKPLVFCIFQNALVQLLVLAGHFLTNTTENH